MFVKNTSFDAELDAGDKYVVAFDFFAVILIRTTIFGKRIKFHNDSISSFLVDAIMFVKKSSGSLKACQKLNNFYVEHLFVHCFVLQ